MDLREQERIGSGGAIPRVAHLSRAAQLSSLKKECPSCLESIYKSAASAPDKLIESGSSLGKGGAILDKGGAICAHCGFSMDVADENFTLGEKPELRVDLFTDDAHCLRLSERQELEARLEDFAGQYAPYFASIYIDTGLEDVSLSEMGFWLLNRSQFFRSEVREDAVDNASGILLLIDVRTGKASLSLGYRAEKILSQRIAARALAAVSKHCRMGQYYKGLSKLLNIFEKEIKKYGQECWERDQK